MIPSDSRVRAELALAAVTVCWGMSFVLVKSAIAQVSTFLFISIRFTMAAIVLALLFRGKLGRYPNFRRTTLQGGAIAGLFLFAGYYFQVTGLRYTTPSKSAFITGLSMAVVPFLAAIVYRRAPQRFEVMGVIVATVGLVLLTMPPDRFSIGYGELLTLCCTFGFAAHILTLGHWAPRSHFELLSVSQIATTAVLALFVCSWAEPLQFAWSTTVVAALLVTGVINTAVAFTVQAWAQQHSSPTRAALIFAIEPVSASITSYFVAGEQLTGRGWAGGAMILAGVLLTEMKPISSEKHQEN